MKQDKLYGIALILGSVLAIITMSIHPSGRQILSNPAYADHILKVNVFAHTLAIAAIPVLVFGFLGFSQRLGFMKPHVSFSFILYVFGSFATMCAAAVSGFVSTELLREYLAADEATRKTLHLLLDYSHWLNAVFANIFIAASSVAILLWSIALFKKSKFANIVAFIGIIFGISGILFLSLGFNTTLVHTFRLFIFGQTLWIILVGVLMIRVDKFLSKGQTQSPEQN